MKQTLFFFLASLTASYAFASEELPLTRTPSEAQVHKVRSQQEAKLLRVLGTNGFGETACDPKTGLRFDVSPAPVYERCLELTFSDRNSYREFTRQNGHSLHVNGVIITTSFIGVIRAQ